MKLLFVSCIFIVVIVVATFVSAQDYTYQDFAAWPGVCNTGKSQSPVDLSSFRSNSNLIDSTLLPIQYENHCHFQDFPVTLINKKHTFDIALKPSSADCKLFDPTDPNARATGRYFSLLQFHWRITAEHQLFENSSSSSSSASPQGSFELQFVHNRTNSKGETELLVIGLVAESVPKSDNPDGQGQSRTIDQLFSPSVLATLDPNFSELQLTPSFVRSTQFTDLFPDDSSYITYSGSLEAPPCTEKVTWIVFNQTIKVWSRTLTALRDIMQKVEQAAFGVDFIGNNRPIQPWNDRVARVFAAAAAPSSKSSSLSSVNPSNRELYYSNSASSTSSSSSSSLDGDESPWNFFGHKITKSQMWIGVIIYSVCVCIVGVLIGKLMLGRRTFSSSFVEGDSRNQSPFLSDHKEMEQK